MTTGQHVHEVGTDQCKTCLLPMRTPLRCGGCNRLLAELVVGQWRIKCARCGDYSQSPDSI